MQEDNNIPLLTDLIERGRIEDELPAETESTELIIEDDTEVVDDTDLLVEDTVEDSDSVELSVEPTTDIQSDHTEIRNYDNVEEDPDSASSSVDFFIDSKQSRPANDDRPLPMPEEAAEDELSSELEDTIQRIIDKHMEQAKHEIRLALQLRKR